MEPLWIVGVIGVHDLDRGAFLFLEKTMMVIGLPAFMAASAAAASLAWLGVSVLQRLLSSPPSVASAGAAADAGDGAVASLVRCDVCGVYVVATQARRCACHDCPHPA